VGGCWDRSCFRQTLICLQAFLSAEVLTYQTVERHGAYPGSPNFSPELKFQIADHHLAGAVKATPVAVLRSGSASTARMSTSGIAPKGIPPDPLPNGESERVERGENSPVGSQGQRAGHGRISLQFCAVMNCERCLGLLVATTTSDGAGPNESA
jgi:hypothetical protein